MIKLAVFDLDGTLAPYDKAALPETVEKLKTFENMGVRICLCSGKPVFYLCAFMRQFGLTDPILIGENGAQIQFGIHLPPRYFHHFTYSEAAAQSLAFFEKAIRIALPDMWFQPNQTELSPFPRCAEEFDIIDSIIAENQDKIRDINIFKYHDCFDFIPEGIEKGAALRYLAKQLGLNMDEIVTVGDSQNDFSMFDCSEKSFGIQLTQAHPKAENVASLSEALQRIEEMIIA